MKLQPIINQLAVYLPFATDYFTNQFVIVGASQSGGTATIITDVVNSFLVGQTIVLTNIVPKVPISSISLNVDTNQITVRTSEDHGLTDSFDFALKQPKTNNFTPKITIVESTESEYNGTFDIIDVPNRFVFIADLGFEPINSPINDGFSLRYASNDYDGAHVITNILDTTTFEYSVDVNTPEITTDSGTVHTSPRISGVVDLTRAEDSYTKKADGQYWMFISNESSEASKNRQFLNDSVDMWGNGMDYRQRLIEGIDLFVFVPTSDQLSARAAIDSLEDVKLAIFQSLIRFKPASLYNSGSSFALTYDSSQTVGYTTSYLIQQYTFQAAFDVTYYDTFLPNVYTPFRNIEGTSFVNDGELDWDVDLDVDPDF